MSTATGDTGGQEHAVPAEPLARRFDRQWAVLLSTRRRDGTWVPTPVTIAVDGERAYFGTPENAGKVRRLRGHPVVRLRPCTPRGRPTGPELQAQARLLHGAEAAGASRLLRRKYPFVHGVVVPVELGVRRARGLTYELTGFRAAPDA